MWGADAAEMQAGGRYAAELEVMVVLGVPTAMLRDSRNEYQPPDLWSIPAEYLTAAGLYSNAHVLKCYELGAAPATLASIPLELPSEPEPEPEPEPVRQPVPEKMDAETEGESARALFERVDVDGNNSLSFEEFASWWSRRQLATAGSLDDKLMSSMRQQWAELDVDGSGSLDCEEFEALITSLATSNWAEAYDAKKGKAYFYNKKTKVTKWHRPDDETAVSEFMQTNGLVLQPSRKPPALEALRRHSAATRPSDGRTTTETTHNPMSGAAFDVETPQPVPRRRTRTAAGVLGQSPPTVAPRPVPQPRAVPSLPTRGIPARSTPRRGRAPTTHGGTGSI